MIRHTYFYALLVLILCFSCSKDDGEDGDIGNPSNDFKGRILYTSVGGTVYDLDMRTGIQKVYFTYNTYGFNGWSLSPDGQYRLTSERDTGNYTESHFILLRADNGNIVKEFQYSPPLGNQTDQAGSLSPDNTMIMIEPDLENGIVVVDLQGQVLHQFERVNDMVIDIGDEAVWMPDNSILFTLEDRYILRTQPPYTQIDLIKEMPSTDWGNINLSPDGESLSMYYNNHIFILDLESGELVQVTDSEEVESYAKFSPDGRYLLVGANFISYLGHLDLFAVPNDGKVHHLYKDDTAIKIQPENDNLNARAFGPVFWAE